MQLLSVHAWDIKQLVDDHRSRFDLGIFACGYESRSTALARSLDHSRFGALVAFSFKELSEMASRTEARKYYDALGGIQSFNLKGSDDIGVYEALRALTSSIDENKPLRVFVDYSSMSRVWYGAILIFFRHSTRKSPVDLFLAYMAGMYRGEVRANQVEIITAVPGFEGIAAGAGSSCAVFALGFDPWCAFAIVERIEPDEVWALLAERPDLPTYLKTARELNKDFIDT